MRRTRRQFVGLLCTTPIALAVSACLGSSEIDVQVTVDGGTPAPNPDGSVAAIATGAPAIVPFTPTPPPSELDPDDLHGFVMPLEGACLPSNDRLMPNAPREYRDGVHEGVDFYFGDSCVVIERGTPVVAAFDGVVVRADHDYRDLTAAQAVELAQRTAEQGFSDPESLDLYRGRQVWIDHGRGVVTRYCHLNSIAAEIGPGIPVRRGGLIGGVGESGTPESITAPGTELHLHWEVRVGDGFLGAGLDPEEVRGLFVRLFQPAETPTPAG
ncbi:MAG: M23 family peptidase [Chloroflexi bacterium]|nr:M23 family peptidase [Chloroflexota bacterium]